VFCKSSLTLSVIRPAHFLIRFEALYPIQCKAYKAFTRGGMSNWRRTLTLTAAIASSLTVAAGATVDTRLPEAARAQDTKAVVTLINQKSDVNARASDGSTALLWLAHWNDGEAAELLLRAGADANAANDFGTSPLSEACLNGSTDMVRLLLRNHANPNLAIGTGETPLMTCAKTGSTHAVRLLLEAGAAVNGREPSQNQTAIMWAAAEKHPGVVKALIDAHADAKSHSKQGFSAIHFAARVGDLESIKVLLASVATSTS